MAKNHVVSAVFGVLFETEAFLEAIRNNKAPKSLSGQLLEEIQVWKFFVFRTQNLNFCKKCIILEIRILRY